MSSARIEVLQQENAQLTAAVSDLTEQLAQVKRQLDWFKRQLFGRTSEKRPEFDEVEQANLFAALGIETPPDRDIPTQEIRYRRREKRRDGAVNECGLRFDETVPVEVIDVLDPAIEAIPEAEREVESRTPTKQRGSPGHPRNASSILTTIGGESMLTVVRNSAKCQRSGGSWNYSAQSANRGRHGVASRDQE